MSGRDKLVKFGIVRDGQPDAGRDRSRAITLESEWAFAPRYADQIRSSQRLTLTCHKQRRGSGSMNADQAR
jgi:hypothetical protein